MKGLIGGEQLSVPVKRTVEEEIVRKQRQYKSLLDINGEELSGPFTELEDNWIGKEKELKKWPPIFQIQIAEFILKADQESDFGKRLFSCCQRAALRRRKLRGGNPLEPCAIIQGAEKISDRCNRE